MFFAQAAQVELLAVVKWKMISPIGGFYQAAMMDRPVVVFATATRFADQAEGFAP